MHTSKLLSATSGSVKMATIEKVRILVVGDSGVGKTSLVHLISYGAPIANPYWTIGCSVEVKHHEYKQGTPAERPYFVELWDVGGWTSHKNSRSIFYNPVHGVILVHDLSNRKSQQNLRKWLAEILSRDSKDVKQEYDFDPEQFAGATVPILVIGTKLDQAEEVRDTDHRRTSSIAEECGADEINMDCTSTKHLQAGTSNAVKLSRFFDKVIERKFHNHESSTHMRYYHQDRRRYISPQGKASHLD